MRHISPRENVQRCGRDAEQKPNNEKLVGFLINGITEAMVALGDAPQRTEQSMSESGESTTADGEAELGAGPTADRA